MEVTYELTPDDLWHYNLYYLRHKDPLQSLLRTSPITKFGYALLCLIMLADTIIFVISLFGHHNVDWGMLFGPAALIFVLPRLLQPTKKRLAKNASQQRGFLCEHIVSISPEWLAERTSVNDSKMAWMTIQTIEEDPAYFFLFLSKRVAFIIPKRAFSSLAEADSFLNNARRYWEAAKNGVSTPVEEVEVWPPPPRIGA